MFLRPFLYLFIYFILTASVYRYIWPCRVSDPFYFEAASAFKNLSCFIWFCSSMSCKGKSTILHIIVFSLVQKYQFLTHHFSFFLTQFVIFRQSCCTSGNIESTISCRFHVISVFWGQQIWKDEMLILFKWEGEIIHLGEERKSGVEKRCLEQN